MIEIKSLQHPLVKRLVALRTQKKEREDTQTVLIESPKVIREIAAKKPLKTMLSLTPSSLQAENAYLVTQEILNKISGMETADTLLAEVDMPRPVSLHAKKWVLALDGVAEPGNLGTLLRTSLAFGWEGVFFLPGTCDPFNEKALRAGRGAIFRLPFAYGSFEDLQKLGLPLLAADLQGERPSPQKAVCLIVGNEAQGLSLKIHDQVTKVSLPMQGEMESLNVAVAGGILLYTLKGMQ